MVSDVIAIGNKVDIRQVSQIENARNTGELPHIYRSQLLDFLENGELELAMPTEGGRIRLLMLGIRYEFVFYTKNGLYRAYGQVRERYKTDNQYMLRVVLNTQLNKYQRREYFRLSYAMEISFCVIDEKLVRLSGEELLFFTSKMFSGEEFEKALQEEMVDRPRQKAYVKDLSGGGVRFVSDEKLLENSYILMDLVLKEKEISSKYSIIGHVIDSEKLEENALARYDNRVEFILRDSKVREDIIRFIFIEERKSCNQRRG